MDPLIEMQRELEDQRRELALPLVAKYERGVLTTAELIVELIGVDATVTEQG